MVLIWLTTILVVACGSTIAWYYFDRYVYPPDPIARGAFPESTAWVYRADIKIVSSIRELDHKIILRTQDAVIAINAQGEEIWKIASPADTRFQPDGPNQAPYVFGNYITVSELGSRIRVLDGDTGKTIWTRSEIDANNNLPPEVEIEDVVSVSNRLYVARSSWSVACYDLRSGQFNWELNVPNRANLHLETDADWLYLGAEDFVQAFDLETGELAWQIRLKDWVDDIAVKNSVLYVATGLNSGYKILAIDKSTRITLWETEISSDVRSLVINNNEILVYGEGLWLVSVSNGEVYWSITELDWLETPVIHKNHIFIRNTEHRLFMIDQQTGEIIGELTVKSNTPMRNDPQRSPAVFGDLLLVPFGDERVIAYRLSE